MCRIVQSAAPSAAGVIEAWEFLGSFGEVLALGRVPALAALEASLADPAAGGGAAEKAMTALVVLVAEETFGAAAAVAAEADPDVRQRDLESAFPVIRVRLLGRRIPSSCFHTIPAHRHYLHGQEALQVRFRAPHGLKLPLTLVPADW